MMKATQITLDCSSNSILINNQLEEFFKLSDEEKRKVLDALQPKYFDNLVAVDDNSMQAQ